MGSFQNPRAFHEKDTVLLPAHGEAVKGSFQYPKTVFTERDLTELEWVLDCTFSALGSPDEETKAFLRYRLFLLACNGVYDSEKLRDRLIASARREVA